MRMKLWDSKKDQRLRYENSLHVAWIYALGVQGLLFQYNYLKWRLNAMQNKKNAGSCSVSIKWQLLNVVFI